MNFLGKINLYKINIQNTLILFWILILLSINVNSGNINFDKTKEGVNFESFFIIINVIRYYFSTFALITLCYRYLLLKKKFDLFSIYIIYGVWQLIIFVIVEKNIKNYDNFQLVFNSIVVALIFIFANTIEDKKKIFKIFLFFIIFLISLIAFYFLFKLTTEFLSDPKMIYLYSSSTLEAETKTFYQASPRVTGISRMLTILFYLFIFLSIKYKKKKLFYNLFFFTILFLLNLFIYAMQSRGSFIGILLIALVYIFIINEKIIKKIFFIFFIFILPILTWETIKYQKIQNYNNNVFFYESFSSNRILNNPIVENYNDISSGRLNIWKKSFEIIKKEKIIFGLGPQADRKYLVKNLFNKSSNIEEPFFWQNNASNAIIYSYLSAGLFGLISIITIYYLIGKELYYFFYIKNLNNNNIYVQFSSLTLLYLTIRTIFENGYSLFSLDYCFISLCYFILINSREKKI
jgi:hypothetical protein